MAKVTVEYVENCVDFPLVNLCAGQVGILTESDGCSKPGDPVIGGYEEACFPKEGSWAHKGSGVNYRFRPLRKGERIIIEGE